MPNNSHVAEPFAEALRFTATAQSIIQKATIKRAVCNPGGCECDIDRDGQPASHGCTRHGTCENCGECLGVRYDPQYPVARPGMKTRDGWVCQKCADCCAECAQHPPTEGHSIECSHHPDVIESRRLAVIRREFAEPDTDFDLLSKSGGDESDMERARR